MDVERAHQPNGKRRGLTLAGCCENRKGAVWRPPQAPRHGVPGDWSGRRALVCFLLRSGDARDRFFSPGSVPRLVGRALGGRWAGVGRARRMSASLVVHPQRAAGDAAAGDAAAGAVAVETRDISSIVHGRDGSGKLLIC